MAKGLQEKKIIWLLLTVLRNEMSLIFILDEGHVGIRLNIAHKTYNKT